MRIATKLIATLSMVLIGATVCADIAHADWMTPTTYTSCYPNGCYETTCSGTSCNTTYKSRAQIDCENRWLSTGSAGGSSAGWKCAEL